MHKYKDNRKGSKARRKKGFKEKKNTMEVEKQKIVRRVIRKEKNNKEEERDKERKKRGRGKGLFWGLNPTQPHVINQEKQSSVSGQDSFIAGGGEQGGMLLLYLCYGFLTNKTRNLKN